MLTLYLACLVFGGVLLGISLMTGGDSSSDIDHSLEGSGGVDFEGQTELTADAAMEVHADTPGHLPESMEIDDAHPAVVSVDTDMADSGASMLHAASEFFSFRNIVYAMTFFGMTGSVLTWLATPFGLTLGASTGMGLFAATVGHRVMRYLRGSESGEVLHVATLVGHPAVVTLPPTKLRKGKVRVTHAGQVVELLALLHEDSESERIQPADRVFIVAISENIAYVDRADFLE
ncbi:MAG: hypothetical protein KFH87_09515 [Bacteroidetes bacterium]|nr:hypothetical protein [Bacteroidota bacterium]